jgi:hypothetical protein
MELIMSEHPNRKDAEDFPTYHSFTRVNVDATGSVAGVPPTVPVTAYTLVIAPAVKYRSNDAG